MKKERCSANSIKDFALIKRFLKYTLLKAKSLQEIPKACVLFVSLQDYVEDKALFISSNLPATLNLAIR